MIDPLHCAQAFGPIELDQKLLIYRGVSNAEYLLMPKALRGLQQFVPYLGEVEPRGYPEQTADLEIKVLQKFYWETDEKGIDIPYDCARLRRLMTPEDRELKKHPSRWPEPDLHGILALAQHAGLPTRLLDWSKSSLVAAFFAAHTAMKSGESDGELVVWVMCKGWVLGPASKIISEPPFEIVTAPTATNARLFAQKGIFTLATQHIGNPQQPQPLDKILEDYYSALSSHRTSDWPNFLLLKVTLPVAHAAVLLSALDLTGINEATMLPT